jgi:hypothetical protein
MDSSVYDELAAYTFTRGDLEFIHQHEVDARGASENIRDAKPIRIFFSLAGLYLLLERNYTGRQIQAAHSHMARVKREWPDFNAPTTQPSMTAADVMKYPAGEERDAAIILWCNTVWETWSAEHARIREETDALLWPVVSSSYYGVLNITRQNKD